MMEIKEIGGFYGTIPSAADVTDFDRNIKHGRVLISRIFFIVYHKVILFQVLERNEIWFRVNTGQGPIPGPRYKKSAMLLASHV